MADELKHTDAAMAAKDSEIAELQAQLAKAGAQPAGVAEEHSDPYPSQAQLDAVKRGEHEADKAGGYKTRQTRAG
jgi:hypothetical protein